MSSCVMCTVHKLPALIEIVFMTLREPGMYVAIVCMYQIYGLARPSSLQSTICADSASRVHC
jgi:hypothetical protein